MLDAGSGKFGRVDDLADVMQRGADYHFVMVHPRTKVPNLARELIRNRRDQFGVPQESLRRMGLT